MKNNNSKNLNSASTSKLLLKLIKPHTRTLVLALLALAAGSGVNLLFPEIIRRILNSDDLGHWQSYLVFIGLGLVGLFALQGLCFYFRSYYFALVGQKVVCQVRKDLYDSLSDRPISFFDRNNISDLVSRISNDAQMLQDAVSIKLSVVLRYALQVVFGVALMASISPTLTGTTLLILPILIFLSMALAKKLKALSKKQQAELGLASSIAQETLDGIRVVKAFNQELSTQKRFALATENVLTTGLARAKVSAFFQSFVSFLLNVAIITVLLLGVHFVSTARLAAGDLTAFLLYGAIVAVSFALVASAYVELLQCLGAAERISELLSPLTERRPPHDKHTTGPLGDITFESVSFSYPSRPTENILKDVSLSIERGTVTALVGPSGAGKSTIVNLLLGFYPPSTGLIKVGGKIVDSESWHQIRESVAWVPQEQLLFGTSLLENLRFGRSSASIEEVQKACQQASILDFIQSLPEGFSTNIGERGIQLSTGQKQRVAIARAILRDPELLILDEATSALDSESEHLIQEALNLLLKNRTALIIAHRLSTVRNAKKVIVLDKGAIIQQGTHEELCSIDGLYKQLVERQELK